MFLKSFLAVAVTAASLPAISQSISESIEVQDVVSSQARNQRAVLELEHAVKLEELRANIAEEKARAADAERRIDGVDGEGLNSKGDILESISPEALRARIGLPPTGPLGFEQRIDDVQIDEAIPAPIVTLPRLVSIGEGSATFLVEGRHVIASQGDAVGQNFQLVRVYHSTARVKGIAGDLHDLSIAW